MVFVACFNDINVPQTSPNNVFTLGVIIGVKLGVGLKWSPAVHQTNFVILTMQKFLGFPFSKEVWRKTCPRGLPLRRWVLACVLRFWSC